MRKSRVTDGFRTRDNRIHNPNRFEQFRALSLLRWALAGTEVLGKARVGVPGPETPAPESDADVMAPLRRVTT